MTILLYDYYELEERQSRHLRVWKAWHTILYIFAALFGIANYTFLLSTMQLVDNNCVLYPRDLAFHWVELPHTGTENYDENSTETTTIRNDIDMNKTLEVNTETVDQKTDAQNTAAVPTNVTERDKAKTTKREIAEMETKHEVITSVNETTIEDSNATIITGNITHRLVLDTSRSLFAKEKDCQFSEYMPVLSTVFATVWATLFIMCPGGGRARTGLQQPWRILTPALLFALVMVGLTGHSFTTTNGGLQDFCAAFRNYSNATTCSAADPLVEGSWNVSWSFAGRAAATRAVSAGAWASWACVTALLLARCLAAPDFVVRRTEAYLRDPHQKITPHLKKSPRRSQRSAQSSPSKRDTVSVRSEPTATTELVTASVEHGPESEPPSLTTTPIRRERKGDVIEMAHMSQELDTQR